MFTGITEVVEVQSSEDWQSWSQLTSRLSTPKRRAVEEAAFLRGRSKYFVLC